MFSYVNMLHLDNLYHTSQFVRYIFEILCIYLIQCILSIFKTQVGIFSCVFVTIFFCESCFKLCFLMWISFIWIYFTTSQNLRMEFWNTLYISHTYDIFFFSKHRFFFHLISFKAFFTCDTPGFSSHLSSKLFNFNLKEDSVAPVDKTNAIKILNWQFKLYC